MKKLLRYFLYFLCIPADSVNAVIIGTARLFWGSPFIANYGVLATEFKKGSWPTKSWFKNWGASTLGHFILFNYGQILNLRVWKHEGNHVEQFEAAVVLGWIIGCTLIAISSSLWWLSLILVICMPFLAYVSAMSVSVLRGEGSAYRDNHLEEAAYAQED